MKFHIIVSKVKDGNMSYKYGSTLEVNRNRNLFFSRLKINQNKAVKLKTVQQNKIEVFLEEIDKNQIESDAIITNVVNQPFYLCFGDCIPFVVWDKKNEILAFAHLGWLDIDQNLHQEVIETMRARFSSEIENLEVVLGPSIKKDSYVFESLTRSFIHKWDSYITKEKDGYHVDINKKVIDDLKKLGLKKINNNVADTGKSEDYFSHHMATYYHTKPNGRFIFGVYLK